jgi:type I restriction enzyme S subunit
MQLKPYPEYKISGCPTVSQIPSQWQVHRCRYLFREVDERSKDGQEIHLSMSQKHGLIDSSKNDKWRLQSESYAGGKLCKNNDWS